MRRIGRGRNDLTLRLEKLRNGRAAMAQFDGLRSHNEYIILYDVQYTSHVDFLRVPPAQRILFCELCSPC